MMSRSISSSLLHPIQVVARRTGLTQDVIRAWERRYGAVHPSRTETGRRLYTDADIQRLILLRRVTLAGRPIGDVARLGDSELRALAESDESAPPPPAPASPSAVVDALPEIHLQTCLRAVEAGDPVRLRAALASALADLSRSVLVEKVVAPLMRAVGERWEHGTLQIYQEHMTTALVRAVLDPLIQAETVSPQAPGLVVATLRGHTHELGAMAVAALAATDGWRVSYLGVDLPSDQIAACAARTRSRAVALSLVHPQEDPAVAEELHALRRLLAPPVTLLVGGPAAQSYAKTLVEIGASHVPDVHSLRWELNRLRSGSEAATEMDPAGIRLSGLR